MGFPEPASGAGRESAAGKVRDRPAKSSAILAASKVLNNGLFVCWPLRMLAFMGLLSGSDTTRQ